MGLVKDKMVELRKEEVAAMLEQYGIKELSDSKHTQSIESIMNELAEGKYILSINNPDMNTNAYLHAIMQQNLIIIDLLNKIYSKKEV